MASRALFGLGLCIAVSALMACGTDSGSPQPATGGTPAAGAASPSAGTSSGAASSMAGAGGNTSAGTGGGVTAGEAGSSSGAGGTAAGGSGGGAGGGSSGPQVDLTDPQLYELELDPHVLDPTTADSPALQYAQLDTRAMPLGKLVIFLPGANNVPRDWRDHGRQLAAFGFHVLIPHYNNRWSTSGVCDGQPNTCSNATRWEALVGEDTSTAIAIPRADSAEGRVVTMIKHLVTENPQGDWGYYLGDNDAVLYDKMIIAGISHGAASTGMYATKRPFTRAVMHSSGPAGSSAEAKMTPLSEWYAFTHTEDPAYDAIAGAIDNWELPGEPTSIDGATPPYGDSHRLITSATSNYPHGSTCAHSSSPMNGDVYVFEAAWRYLYGAPAQ